MIKKAGEMLSSGEVYGVLAWERGDFACDQTPALFTSPESLSRLAYDEFTAPMLSKYLINEAKKPNEGKKVMVFLKPCDTYNFGHLLSEHKVERDRVYAVGVACSGIFSREKTLLEKCLACKGMEFHHCDEVIGGEGKITWDKLDRFAGVEMIESMTPSERFEFWRGELSRCIRCNACRNVCPVCSCVKCVFDNPGSGVMSKSNADEFEENMFHIIRAFHVAGRCTDCGECSRVCPRNIPLHLLNRKFIKDVNALFGPYQAGASLDDASPLTSYSVNDPEPGYKDKAKGGERVA